MTDFIKIITHARRLKSALKPLPIEELEDIRRKLDTIIESREMEMEEERKLDKEKQEKIAKYKEMMENDGLALDDLKGVVKKTVKKRSKRPPKYEVTVDGKRITWTGHGRMPQAFRERIDAGAKKEDFLIK